MAFQHLLAMTIMHIRSPVKACDTKQSMLVCSGLRFFHNSGPGETPAPPTHACTATPGANAPPQMQLPNNNLDNNNTYCRVPRSGKVGTAVLQINHWLVDGVNMAAGE